MKKTLLMSALAMAGMTSAHAVELKAGDWTVNVGGIINAYYTSVKCKDNNGVGLAASCGGSDKATQIGNGLLPNGLIVSAKTTQNGIDVGATMGIYSAVSTNSSVAPNGGGNGVDGTGSIDVRQGFMTLGTKDTGTFKIGRDYGIFGSNAILNDMTLLGVGAPVQVTQKGRVSLGHIGAGYTYLGNYGQMTYSSPSMGGVKIDGGLFSPVDATGTAVADTKGTQLQAQLSYTQGGLKAWMGTKQQDYVTPGTNNKLYKTSGYEVGALLSLGDLGLLANYQGGKGLGIVSDGDAGDRDSNNTFLQATYKVMPKLKVGVTYGKSENDRTTGDTGATLEYNQNQTLGAYYSLTPSVTLVGEVSNSESKNFGGLKSKRDGFSFGAIMFF